MELICKCGNNCLKSASSIFNIINDFYTPCGSCKDFKLKKFSPLNGQMDLENLNADFGRCDCGKRHLDVVMAHILKLMMEEDIKSEESTLRNVCVPLITPAYPTNSVPHLPENSMVILSGEVDNKCAQRIIKEIPEIKGVLKGNLTDTVGIKASKSTPTTYELLAGCDLRCDIINTPWETICIYKYQRQIHIEFPQPLSPKIKTLNKGLSKYDNPKVLDCTCGPGTLGIAALIAGASYVVFNDLWHPACKTTAMNLEVNGFPVEYSDESALVACGENFKIYNLDIKELGQVLDEKFDVCLIDVFPGVEMEEFVDAARDLCQEVVII